jgi:hypothetical protein
MQEAATILIWVLEFLSHQMILRGMTVWETPIVVMVVVKYPEKRDKWYDSI